MTIALHVDGGHGVGLGHAMRGIGLARSLKAMGREVVFLVEPSLEGVLSEQGMSVRVGPASPESLWLEAEQAGARALVADSYRLDPCTLAARRPSGMVLACFDDKADRELPVDLVINGAPGAIKLAYRTGATTRLLLGPDYQIVRPDFLVPPARDYKQLPANVLVTLGGDDLLGIADRLLEALQDWAAHQAPDFVIDFIVGPFFQRVPAAGPNVQLHRHPPDMPRRIRTADLAITAGGQTLYELACSGVPTVALCVGEDQLVNLASLEERGSLISVGWAKGEAWLLSLKQAMTRLMQDPEERQRLGTAGRAVLDGQGANRIAHELVAALPSR